MIMMGVTAKVAVEPLVVAVQTVMTAPMIGQLMDPSAVIQLGMNMVLIVPRYKVHMAGIVPAVIVLVTVAALMVALMVVVAVKRVILMTVPVMVTAVQSLGLVMALPIVKIRHMAVI